MADLPHTGWQDADSVLFDRWGSVLMPFRGEQFRVIGDLVPAHADEEFVAVDLACGTGLLSALLLERFPHCRVLALDGNAVMLDAARRLLAPFGARVRYGMFDLREDGWLRDLSEVRTFVSSLAIHHLDGTEKQRLFRRLAARLEPRGALLIADLVEPVNEVVRIAYAHDWDEEVRCESLGQTGGLAVHRQFRAGWNHYTDPDLDFDKPSGLFEQLCWLREAGFSQVDCFWLRAGHAVYGGYAPTRSAGSAPIPKG